MSHHRLGWLTRVFAFALAAFSVALAGAQPATDSAPGATTEQTTRERETIIRETETRVVERQREKQGPYTCAIFIKNRAKNIPDDKVSVLEDFVVGQITDKGFKIISREDVLNAVASFANAGPNRGDPNGPGADLDTILSNNTSALRLAQNLNADYILSASITTFGTDTIDYIGNGISTHITESKLNVSYKILDIVLGGSLTAGVVEASDKQRAQPGLTINKDVVNTLLNDASVKLAEALGKKAAQGRIPQVAQQSKNVEFGVLCSMADLSVPEVVRDDKGEYTVTANRYTVQAMAVTVALDGITIGTTPGPFQAPPGLHKIRLTREGFKDWEQTINVRDGLTLNVALQMTPAGYARWQQNITIINDLKTGARLSEAQAKAVEGVAKMFEQSGFRVDVRKDIKKNVNVNQTSNENRDERTVNVPTEREATTTQPMGQ